MEKRLRCGRDLEAEDLAGSTTKVPPQLDL